MLGYQQSGPVPIISYYSAPIGLKTLTHIYRVNQRTQMCIIIGSILALIEPSGTYNKSSCDRLIICLNIQCECDGK